MENHTSGEFEAHLLLLPNEIIHHIQSFLDGKQAAETAILSKSWHRAWSTRPDLVFADLHFWRLHRDEFDKFTNKTMQRYEDLNLKIHSLELAMQINPMNTSLATELIVRAIRLGAVNLDINLIDSSYVLPKEVFESQTLTRLSLHGCTIDLHTRNNIACSQLKSLCINQLYVINGDLIRDLVSRCPLIERLTINAMPIKLHEYHDLEFGELKYLSLACLDVKACVPKHALWPKLPHLKQLVISSLSSVYDYDSNGDAIRICSPSLEHIVIRLSPDQIMTLEFDVPNLVRFEFHGSPFSRLCFKATSCREWESDLHVKCPYHKLSASWLSSLERLVEMLSLSRVSLSIDVRGGISFEAEACLATPLVVECLRLESFGMSRAVLDSLFSICRPKFVIQRCSIRDSIKKHLVKLVRKRLLEGFTSEEIYQESRPYWTNETYAGHEFVRFQLRWGL